MVSGKIELMDSQKAFETFIIIAKKPGIGFKELKKKLGIKEDQTLRNRITALGVMEIPSPKKNKNTYPFILSKRKIDGKQTEKQYEVNTQGVLKKLNPRHFDALENLKKSLSERTITAD